MSCSCRGRNENWPTVGDTAELMTHNHIATSPNCSTTHPFTHMSRFLTRVSLPTQPSYHRGCHHHDNGHHHHNGISVTTKQQNKTTFCIDNNHTGFIRVRASGVLNFEPLFHVPCFILQQLAHLHLRVLLSFVLRFFVFSSSILLLFLRPSCR